jgi:outer membrane lipoprotein-sorting protein
MVNSSQPMKNIFIVLAGLLVMFHFHAKGQTGVDILKALHKNYYKGPCSCYTFSQKNTHYHNDSITGHSEWHEAVKFPDKFRIDFGDKKAGNYVVFRNDSVFNYRGGKFLKSRVDSNTLLLILGGMFYRDFDNVVARLKNAGYNLDAISSNTWQEKDVYVLGAKENDMSSNQIWVDKNNWRVVRIIEKMNDKETMDMRFESHQGWCKGYVENKVSFRRNGKLEQVEEYYDIKKADKFPE